MLALLSISKLTHKTPICILRANQIIYKNIAYYFVGPVPVLNNSYFNALLLFQLQHTEKQNTQHKTDMTFFKKNINKRLTLSISFKL